jgi:hypothetical protein
MCFEYVAIMVGYGGVEGYIAVSMKGRRTECLMREINNGGMKGTMGFYLCVSHWLAIPLCESGFGRIVGSKQNILQRSRSHPPR